jgi:hypothetical protein
MNESPTRGYRAERSNTRAAPPPLKSTRYCLMPPRLVVLKHHVPGCVSPRRPPSLGPAEEEHVKAVQCCRPRTDLRSTQCQGEVAAFCGGWILITWCLARTLRATVGLAFMRFVGIRCEGPAGVT